MFSFPFIYFIYQISLPTYIKTYVLYEQSTSPVQSDLTPLIFSQTQKGAHIRNRTPKGNCPDEAGATAGLGPLVRLGWYPGCPLPFSCSYLLIPVFLLGLVGPNTSETKAGTPGARPRILNYIEVNTI